MDTYNYDIIKILILEWYVNIQEKFLNRCVINMSKNSDNVLIIDFEFQNCIAQLSVTNLLYVPYKYVYFEAMDLEEIGLETLGPIYCFCDDDTMKKDAVINSLDEAVLFCVNYKK